MSVHSIEGQIVSDDCWLPEPESVRGGEGPYIIPIVDDVYGGVICWANTKEQAARIVEALNERARLRDLLASIAEEASSHMRPMTLKEDGLRRVRDKALYELAPNDPNVQIEILRTGKAPS